MAEKKSIAKKKLTDHTRDKNWTEEEADCLVKNAIQRDHLLCPVPDILTKEEKLSVWADIAAIVTQM